MAPAPHINMSLFMIAVFSSDLHAQFHARRAMKRFMMIWSAMIAGSQGPFKMILNTGYESSANPMQQTRRSGFLPMRSESQAKYGVVITSTLSATEFESNACCWMRPACRVRNVGLLKKPCHLFFQQSVNN